MLGVWVGVSCRVLYVKQMYMLTDQKTDFYEFYVDDKWLLATSNHC